MDEQEYLDPEDVVDNEAYERALFEDHIKRNANQLKCEHPHFMIKCSHCGKILGSEANTKIEKC